jgi:hypothetical protein
MQVYITKSNANRILKQIDYDKIPDDNTVVVYTKPLYFLASWELKKLRAAKILYENFEIFVKEYYQPLDNSDTFTYVFEGGQAAYHSINTCERLSSNYTNFKIPESIKSKGKEEVMKFRAWFKANRQLLEDRQDIFYLHLTAIFGVEALQVTSTSNSGTKIKENYDLKELEQHINDYIRREYEYIKNPNTPEKDILLSFRKLTYLAYNKKPIKNNNTNFSDDEIRTFLLAYDRDYKKPIIELLTEYYRVKNNPRMVFQGHLLEQLGFKPCSYCFPDIIS